MDLVITRSDLLSIAAADCRPRTRRLILRSRNRWQCLFSPSRRSGQDPDPRATDVRSDDRLFCDRSRRAALRLRPARAWPREKAFWPAQAPCPRSRSPIQACQPYARFARRDRRNVCSLLTPAIWGSALVNRAAAADRTFQDPPKMIWMSGGVCNEAQRPVPRSPNPDPVTVQ